jgi:hypothetical protein
MAEETTNPLTGVLEEAVTEVVQQAVEPATEVVESEPQYTEVEQRAMDMGWKPLDQWDGDKADHRTAKEYLDRGELLGKIKQQGSELRELRDSVRLLSDHNRKVHEEAYKQAIADLKKAKVEALRNGEVEEVVDLDEQLDARRQELQVIQNTPRQQPKTPEASPIFQDWLSRNKWYSEDEAMQFWANGEAIKFARKTGRADESEIYKHLDKAVREEFPHKFKRAAAPAPDGASRRSAGGGGQTAPKSGDSDFKSFLSSLPRDEARMVENLVENFNISPEQYMNDYNLVNKRGGR